MSNDNTNNSNSNNSDRKVFLFCSSVCSGSFAPVGKGMEFQTCGIWHRKEYEYL